MTRFGTTAQPELGAVTEELVSVLRPLPIILGDAYSFGETAPLTLTPEKTYTARTDVPVLHDGTEVGKMVVIAFAPGDATGSTADYTVGSIALHSYLPKERTERFHPRNKTGFEAYFPLLTVQGDRFLPFVGSLDLLTLDPTAAAPRLVKGWSLGLSPANYEILRLRDGIMNGLTANLQLTTGYRPDGTQFGNPHAIYHNQAFDSALQVAGFLAVTDPTNPLWQRLAAIEPSRPSWATPLPLPEKKKEH